MNEENQWQENPESGITPGPEEALRKEIEKSKALKVERLQLRNQLGSLRLQNQRLQEENQRLKEKPSAPEETEAVSLNSHLESETRGLSPLLTVLRNGLFFLVFIIFFYFLLQF